MNRDARIAIWVLTLIGLLAAWKLFGQGFGNFRTDQPFLARNYQAAQTVQPPQSNLSHWWHASDVTNATATNWIDRIQGALFTSAGAAAPPANGTNLEFSGTHFMTNASMDNTYVLNKSNFFVLVYSSTNTGNYNIFTGPASSVAGFYSFSGTLTYYDGVGLTMTTPFYPSNIADVVFVGLQGQAYQSIYTNGVLADTDNVYSFSGSQWLISPSYAANYPPKMLLYDILVYTNVSGGSTVLSNIHYWATNTYKYAP